MNRIRNYYYNKLSHDYKIAVKVIYKQLLKYNKIIEVDYVINDMYSIIECLKYTFPELFYVDFFHVEYSINSSKTSIKFKFLYSIDEIDACNKNINKIVSKIDLKENEAKIVSRVFNTIISHVAYDSYDLKEVKNSNHDIYGAIMFRESVCEGMSLLFLHICNMVKIDCTVVTGKIDGVNHMWNVVRIDGILANIDIVRGMSCLKNNIKYGGYILPNYLMKDYQLDAIIDCNSLVNNPYYYNDMHYNDLSELSYKVKYFLNKMDRVVLMYTGKETINSQKIVDFIGPLSISVRYILYDIYLVVEKID